MSSGADWLPRLAIYGDLGFQNEQSLPYLTKDVEKDLYDVIFHIGDLGKHSFLLEKSNYLTKNVAYDLYERNGEQGNDFMRSIEKVAAKVPYMTIPGKYTIEIK